MTLLLVQHGRCLSKDQDPEQSLTGEGIAEVERIADVAKNYGVTVSAIEHSLKKRARQTAGIFAAALGPPGGVEEKTGLKPMDDPRAVADRMCTADDVMLVGHLPFMERLTSLLITGSADKIVFKFQNGGIVCLDQDQGGDTWFIKWALMPEIK